MISWHRVGQHVVCKPTAVRSGEALGETWPKAGTMYTIREVVLYAHCTAFRFVEITNTPKQWLDRFGESSFPSEFFEPIYPHAVERLRDLCSPTPEQKREFFKELVDGHAAGWRY